MKRVSTQAKWVGGLAEWVEDDVCYLSVAFSWKIDEAVERAMIQKFLGRRVIAGGPGLFTSHIRHIIEPYAEIGTEYPDAITKHNPLATRASRGCSAKERGCKVPCIVPAMDGDKFSFFPDFAVRPILCDDNLSALPIEYQKHIVGRYIAEDVPLLDANSGFEPATFTEEIYRLWKQINRGPWRFANDDAGDRKEAVRVMRMLKDEPGKKKRVYVLIGNEPFAECMARVQEVIDHGCEPHAQPVMRLNARTRDPWVQHDWTAQKLKDVARWVNGWVWRKAAFADYDPKMHKRNLVATGGGLF